MADERADDEDAPGTLPKDPLYHPNPKKFSPRLSTSYPHFNSIFTRHDDLGHILTDSLTTRTRIFDLHTICISIDVPQFYHRYRYLLCEKEELHGANGFLTYSICPIPQKNLTQCYRSTPSLATQSN
ncbi:hypothetical protein VNI00_010829 [Paramarasmius palmivorus]|uniref:Uncharacterized protein n=1 Tax=Paramarasmius palmivorus TaxID=297713 RepID=A0AAW0CDE2_9AGAR